MSRLVALTSAAVLLEMLFFGALGPLLPELKESFALSASEAGLLVAAYTGGMTIATIPAAWLAVRNGVKRTLIVSLMVFAATSVAFGLGQSYPALLAAQLTAGMAGAAIWGASMVWLISATSKAQRGEMIGIALSAVAAGQLMGPVLGAIASAVGRAPTFATTAALAVLLGCVACTFVAPERPRGSLGMRIVAGSHRIRAAAWLNALAGVAAGASIVLAALHLHDLGSGPGEIAATFVIAAAAGLVIHPLIGRWSDRRGRLRPIRVGLLVTIPLLTALAWLHNRWGAALLIVIALVAVRTLWGPALALLADTTDDAGVGPIAALAVSSLLGSVGFTAGSAGSGAIAQAAGTSWAYGALATLLLSMYVVLNRQDRGPARAGIAYEPCHATESC